MTKLIMTTAVALALGTSAFAKAHDQGVADGNQNFAPGQLKGAVSGIVRNGGAAGIPADSDTPGNALSELAREVKDENRTVPVDDKK